MVVTSPMAQFPLLLSIVRLFPLTTLINALKALLTSWICTNDGLIKIILLGFAIIIFEVLYSK